MNDSKEDSPALPYLSMWTTPDGLSSIGLTELRGFFQGSVGGKASPLWMGEMPGTVEKVLFNLMEVGWQGEWHESPKPQWIIPLTGRWFIETQDGNRVGRPPLGPRPKHERNRRQRRPSVRTDRRRALCADDDPVLGAPQSRVVRALRLKPKIDLPNVWGRGRRPAASANWPEGSSVYGADLVRHFSGASCPRSSITYLRIGAATRHCALSTRAPSRRCRSASSEKTSRPDRVRASGPRGRGGASAPRRR